MRSMVISEKPDQAQKWKPIVGTTYGPIYAARGHLFKLMEPQALNPEWAEWSPGMLRRGTETYPSVLEAGYKKKAYDAIKSAARKVDRIYVATDPDREGEGIGGDIVAQLKKDLNKDFEVLRVLPLGDDPKSVKQMFIDARPASDFKALYQSYRARINADQIYNLSLTRTASTTIKGSDGGSLSIGRVLTPTMGIVCRREREIADFRPRDYFHPWVDVCGDAGKVRLTHRCKEEDRIFDQAEAQRAADAASRWAGPIDVVEARKRQTPPLLLSLTSLQVEASKRLKWGIERTEEVLQSLYEKHKVATYPRSSEISLPEAEIENAPAMLAGAMRLSFMQGLSWGQGTPTIRKKKGAFSDADLKGAAHYAIVPNINTVDEWAKKYETMTADEKALFELLVRRYVSAIGPDRVYDSTKLSVNINGGRFDVSGTVEIEAGWREASGAVLREDDAEDDDSGSLPKFKSGDQVRAEDCGTNKLTTKAPPRYTGATLGLTMIEAWKFETDPELRDILKESSGIGTVATRKEIIKNLKDRNFAVEKGGKLHAGEAGLQLFDILLEVAPNLLDVGLTAKMERVLDTVKSGEIGALSAVNKVCEIAETAVDAFIAAGKAGRKVTADLGGKRGGKGRKKFGVPTSKMKFAAKKKAESKGMKAPPAGVLTDFDKCRAFLSDGAAK